MIRLWDIATYQPLGEPLNACQALQENSSFTTSKRRKYYGCMIHYLHQQMQWASEPVPRRQVISTH
jgi:hypothetical protein